MSFWIFIAFVGLSWYYIFLNLKIDELKFEGIFFLFVGGGESKHTKIVNLWNYLTHGTSPLPVDFLFSWMWCLNHLMSYFQNWYRCPLGFKDNLISFWWHFGMTSSSPPLDDWFDWSWTSGDDYCAMWWRSLFPLSSPVGKFNWSRKAYNHGIVILLLPLEYSLTTILHISYFLLLLCVLSIL